MIYFIQLYFLLCHDYILDKHKEEYEKRRKKTKPQSLSFCSGDLIANT